jgi:exosortase A
MSAPTLAQPTLAGIGPGLRGIALPFGAGLLALALLFHTEIIVAVRIWIASTAYNHCFLVLPIAAYLAWDRRDAVRGMSPVPMPLAAIGMLPLAVAWLVAERLGIMEGRQLVAISMIEVLCFAMLGWRLWWQLSGPLLYLYFLVPFGDFLTPQLQDFTTAFVQHGLDLLRIPAYIDGYTIEIPEGTFFVAEACAGLRFLIASIAFGVLYALLMYRSPWRRVGFIAASLIVPIIANGFRALGIVWLGHLLGSAQAAATDHVLYGWIFFSLVILLLIVLGLPFRQDQARPQPPAAASGPRPDAAAASRGALLAAVLVVLLAAVSPALALVLDRAGAASLAQAPVLDFGPGCTNQPGATPPPGTDPSTSGPGQLTVRRVTCGALVMDVRIAVFPRHSTAAPVFAEQRRLTVLNLEDIDTAWLPSVDGQPRVWREVRGVQRGPFIVSTTLVEGQPTAGGLRTRVRMAWASLVGAQRPPVVIAIAPQANWGQQSADARITMEQRLAQLLADQHVVAQAGRIGAPE